jgi:hypothetical protein
VTRTELDARLARILADAIVRELRVEMATVHDESALAGQGDTRSECPNEAGGSDDTDKRLPRAS